MSIPRENQSVTSACVAFIAIAVLAIAMIASSGQVTDPSTTDTYSKHSAVVLAESPVEHRAEAEFEEYDPSLSSRFLPAADGSRDTNRDRLRTRPLPAIAFEHDPKPD